MSESITKEELRAMVDIQSKNVEQLTTIANHLAVIVDAQEDIHDRLYNGMAKEISENVITAVRECNKHCSEAHTELKTTLVGFPATLDEKIKNSDISKDIKHSKWFIAIIGLVIVVTTVVLRGLDNRWVVNSENKEIKEMAIQLKEHISSLQGKNEQITSQIGH